MSDKGPQGFARLDPEARREVSRRGGKAVAAEKRGWSKDKEAAREAGRKGGQVSKKPKASASTSAK